MIFNSKSGWKWLSATLLPVLGFAGCGNPGDSPDLYEDDFMDVWEHRYHPYRNREWMRREECSECKFFRYCRGGAMHLRDSDGSMLMCPLHRLG